ncbi:MAG: glutathione S-transferase family protein [Rhodothalassiaceae bacterium]
MPLTLYDFARAPSPRRARIVLAEKGIDYDKVQVDLSTRAQLEDSFKAINPRCTVPALKLEDGTVLCDNAGIAAYAEALVPEPNLLGSTPEEKGLVADWTVRIEFEGLSACAEVVRNSAERLKGRAVVGPDTYAQIPALAERGAVRLKRFFETLNERLSGRDYIAIDRFSYADITALVAVDFAAILKITPSEGQSEIKRWHAAVSARPSASA